MSKTAKIKGKDHVPSGYTAVVFVVYFYNQIKSFEVFQFKEIKRGMSAAGN